MPVLTLKKLTPRRIVEALDQYIVGQAAAKRVVALALRGRWRRMNADAKIRDEIKPKNILMMGPTGVGKTEISRRLARLSRAPFVKVEATKFTEVGYVGRDVDSIVRDLVEIAMDEERADAADHVRERAEQRAEERVLDALLPGVPREESGGGGSGGEGGESGSAGGSGGSGSGGSGKETREKFRKMFRDGKLNDREIEIETSVGSQLEVLSPPGMEEITSQLQSMMQSFSKERKRSRRMRALEAYDICVEEEISELVDMHDIKERALGSVEENGIVFIDEIDKIIDPGASGPDISRHGVQRDLLPLVEGTTVQTRHGVVHTDHILFIASGAFHYGRPSDLIPELQGRFPLRVELAPLTAEDFEKILNGTHACLTAQYKALLKTEGVRLSFTDDAVRAIAEVAWRINERGENIGARRLYTIMERLLDDISFDADKMKGQSVVVDEEMVRGKLSALSEDSERTSYVL